MGGLHMKPPLQPDPASFTSSFGGGAVLGKRGHEVEIINGGGIRKGVAWSETEHLQFLEGLRAFGKGQWKQISRYFVPTRTPTQVASHAQKHFLRVTGVTKRRSRFTAVEESARATHRSGPGAGLEGQGQPSGSFYNNTPVLAAAGGAKGGGAESQQQPSPAAASMASLSGYFPHTFPGNQYQQHYPAATHPLPSAAAHLHHINMSMASMLPPPIDSDGIALGLPIPIPPRPALSAPQATGTAPTAHSSMSVSHHCHHQQQMEGMTTTASMPHHQPTMTKLPMLATTPGRIRAPMVYENKPRSPAPHQTQVVAPSSTRQRSTPARVTANTRRAQLLKLGELREGRVMSPAQEALMHKRLKELREHWGTGHSGCGVNGGGSAASDQSDAGHAGLDALAGIAGALVDEEETMV